MHSATSPDLTGGLLRQVHVLGVWGRQVGPLASKGLRPLAELGFQSSVELSAASPVVNPSRFSGPCKAPPHPNSDGFTVLANVDLIRRFNLLITALINLIYYYCYS